MNTIPSKTNSPPKSPVLVWQQGQSSWPSLPGVYWFGDSGEKILYVGKAKNLKNRLTSYTRVDPAHKKTFKLVHTATKLNFKILDSEIEALLTEAALIKTYQPPFNILLKDDKSPLYIILTNESFPRVLTARKKQLATIYHNLPAKNVFGPFNSATDAKRLLKLARKIFKFCQTPNQHRQCFYTHLGLCSGACIGAISQVEYKKMISHLRIFLQGRKKRLLSMLRQSMTAYSKALDYENAAVLRDQIHTLEYLLSQKTLPAIDLDPITLKSDQTSEMLTQTSSLLHQIGLTPAGYPLRRIECYDISNTSGQLATASMVVFIDGKPAYEEYRKFKIKYTVGPNDFAMLKEAINRRLNHPEWDYPQLLIVDGGKGQLSKVISLTAGKIPTIGIAKKPDRLVAKINDQYIIIPLPDSHPISRLIQQLRNESHRFAKKYHTKLRSKALLTNS